MPTIQEKLALFKNSIAHQRKTSANSLTIAEWNEIINVLRIQANANTDGIIAANTIIDTVRTQNVDLLALFNADMFYTKDEINEIVLFLTTLDMSQYQFAVAQDTEPTNPLVTIWYDTSQPEE